jgi:hypothetical protein
MRLKVSAVLGLLVFVIALFSVLQTEAAPAVNVVNVRAGESLQVAVNTAAASGVDTTLVLDAGAAYSEIVLPAKSAATRVTIQTSALGQLPEGVRVTPSQSSLLAKIQSTAPATPAIQTAPGANGYAFIGVEVAAANPTHQIFDLVRLGTTGENQDTLSEVPTGFLIDRSYIHGFATQEVQRGIALNSADTAITNSYISEIHGRGYDTQAICGWNGPGPFKIVNNYLEGAGENVMFGGALATIQNLIPSNIEFRGNHVFKPLSWKEGHPTFVPLTPLPGSTLNHWSVKNLFELKNARNVVIDGNLFENSWTDGQIGYAILFTVRGEGNNQMPWATIQNVSFTNNIVRGTDQGIQTLGLDNLNASTRASGLYVYNNLFENIKHWFFVLNGFHDTTIEHNTHQQGHNVLVLTGDKSERFIYRNNATFRNPNGFGVFGDAVGEGSVAFETFTPGAIVQGNVIAGALERIYPSGNFYPADLSGLTSFRGTDGLVPGYLGSSVPTPTPTPTPTPEPTPTPTPTQDTVAPTATLTSPSNGATLSGTVTVTATAQDNVAVNNVYLIVDDSVVVGPDTEAPYSFKLDTTKLSEGSHFMYIRAWDASGNAGDSPRITVTVANTTPTPTPTPERPVYESARFDWPNSVSAQEALMRQVTSQGYGSCFTTTLGKSSLFCTRIK